MGDEQQTNPRDDRVKLRMFRRFNVAARAVPAATAEASTVNDGPEDGNKVIRRKLIAEEQMLINDPEDTSELMSEEEAAAPSYINVLVSWFGSHPFRGISISISFLQKQI